MGHHTLAIVSYAANEPPAIEEIVLDAPRSDEAVVEIQAVGVCHADLAVLHGTIPLPFPRVLGHEGSSNPQDASSTTLTRLADQALGSLKKSVAMSKMCNLAIKSS